MGWNTGIQNIFRTFLLSDNVIVNGQLQNIYINKDKAIRFLVTMWNKACVTPFRGNWCS